jgi:hypothetical protein
MLERLSKGFWIGYWSGLVIGFTGHLYTPLGTTSNYRVTANLHNSQITPAPAKSFPVCCVFTSRSLAAASNSAASSASHAQVLSSQPLYRTDLVAPTVFLATPRHRPRIQHRSSVACVSIAAGTCLPSRSLAAALYSCLLSICCLATDVVPLSVSRPLTTNECCFRAVL